MSDKFEFEIYNGKVFKDLLKDVVLNSEARRNQVDTAISDLRDLIKNINDAVTVAPMIKDYLDVGVKNDEHLVKLASVVQKLITLKSDDIDDGFGLTDQEKDELLKDIKNIEIEVKSPIEIKKIKN